MIYPTQKPEQYSDWVEFFKAERLTVEICPNSDLKVIYIPSLGMFDTGPSLYYHDDNVIDVKRLELSDKNGEAYPMYKVTELRDDLL